MEQLDVLVIKTRNRKRKTGVEGKTSKVVTITYAPKGEMGKQKASSTHKQHLIPPTSIGWEKNASEIIEKK